MATRATYRLINKDFTNNTTEKKIDVYIHWDGYEQGALNYYLKAIEAYYQTSKKDWRRERKVKGSFIESFIYANISECEITQNYQIHGDTEFHYEMSLDQVVVYSKNWDDEKFQLKEILTPKNFFLKYAKSEDWAEEREKFIFMGNHLITIESIEENLKDKIEDFQDYQNNKRQQVGNFSRCAEELYKKLIQAKYLKPEYFNKYSNFLDEIIKEAAFFAAAYNWNLNQALRDPGFKVDFIEDPELTIRLNRTRREEAEKKAYSELAEEKKAIYLKLATKKYIETFYHGKTEEILNEIN
jgi:hypothetical protein